MILGTTYSHRHIQYLALDNEQAFGELLQLRFGLLRLCCYWDEIQPEKNTFDFSKIRYLLEKCEQAGQKVIVTLGMKAPRWPEYYLPTWLNTRAVDTLSEEISSFLTQAINSLKDYTCIKYWQVENEPLDPAGPEKLVIPGRLLKEEVALVKSLDPTREIIVTVWGNEARQRNTLQQIGEIGDILGLDLYFTVPFLHKFYRGPKSPLSYYKKVIADFNKPVWITELQAEPWEHNQLVATTKITSSMNPDILKQNFEKACALQTEVILFWGYEYWFYKKMQGDSSYWQTIRQLLNL